MSKQDSPRNMALHRGDFFNNFLKESRGRERVWFARQRGDEEKICSSDSSARCCGHPPAAINDNALVFCFESSNLSIPGLFIKLKNRPEKAIL